MLNPVVVVCCITFMCVAFQRYLQLIFIVCIIVYDCRTCVLEVLFFTPEVVDSSPSI